MAPVLLTGLVSTLTRQLRHLRLYAAGHASPAAGVYRCLSSAITAQARPFLSTGVHQQTCMPLLGQCQQLPCVQQFAGMKTKTALKRRCKDCFFVRRRGRLFVFCKTNPRHKQRQG